MNPDFVSLTLHFSPELVKPHPKAAPQKQRKNQTRKRKAAILSDTSEKQALEKESQIKELRKRKNDAGCRKKASTRKSNKIKRRIEMEFEPDNTEVFCLQYGVSGSIFQPQTRIAMDTMHGLWKLVPF